MNFRYLLFLCFCAVSINAACIPATLPPEETVTEESTPATQATLLPGCIQLDDSTRDDLKAKIREKLYSIMDNATNITSILEKAGVELPDGTTGFYPGSDALGDQHQLQFASTVPYLHCAVRKIFDILRAEYINQTLSEIDETITRRFHAILDILWPWAHGSTGLPSEVESIVRAEVINECVIPSIMDKCPSTSSALSLAQNALLLAEEINDVAEDHCEASDMVL